MEHIGDSITHEIAKKLNQTFITPIDREDIHALASALDDILDLVEAVADQFVVFRVTTPTDPARKWRVFSIVRPWRWAPASIDSASRMRM